MRILVLSQLLLLAATSVAQAPNFAKMAEERKPLYEKNDWKTLTTLAQDQRKAVYEALEKDQVKSPLEFFQASAVAGDPFGDFEACQLEHELVVTALLLGHEEAIKRSMFTWDRLMFGLGRPQRFGSIHRMVEGKKIALNMDPETVPPGILATLENPAEARKKAAAAKDNAELQKLCDEDQAARQPPITMEKIKLMEEGDPKRRARVLELLAEGVPVTGRDFYNCSLVLQHGEGFHDYMLAHECILAAAILGEKNANWLVSRTYDRMLQHTGHRQRFGTQYNSGGLMPIDTPGPSNTMRKLMNAKPLEELRKDHPRAFRSG